MYCFYAGAEDGHFVKQYQQFGLADGIAWHCGGFVTEGGVLKAQGDAALGIEVAALLRPARQPHQPEVRRPTTAPNTATPRRCTRSRPTTRPPCSMSAGQGATGDAIVEGLKGVGEVDSPRAGPGASPTATGRPGLPARDRGPGQRDRQRHRAAAHRFLTVPAWLSVRLITIVDSVAFGVLLFTIAVGLSLVFGIMDVLNLAHTGRCTWSARMWPSASPATAPAGARRVHHRRAGRGRRGRGRGAGLAVLTQPLARRGHLDQALSTLGEVALIIGDLLSSVRQRRPESVPPPAFLAGSVSLGSRSPGWLAVIVAGLALAVLVLAGGAEPGRGAGPGDGGRRPDGQALGVDTGRLVVAVFAFGVVLACLGAVLGAPVLGAYPGLDERVLILGLVVVVLGGARVGLRRLPRGPGHRPGRGAGGVAAAPVRQGSWSSGPWPWSCCCGYRHAGPGRGVRGTAEVPGGQKPG